MTRKTIIMTTAAAALLAGGVAAPLVQAARPVSPPVATILRSGHPPVDTPEPGDTPDRDAPMSHGHNNIGNQRHERSEGPSEDGGASANRLGGGSSHPSEQH